MEALNNSISNFIEVEGIIAEVYMILKIEDSYTLREMDIKGENQLSITENFIDYFKTDVIEKEGLQLLKLTNHDERSNVIYEYDFESFPEDFSILNLLEGNPRIDKFKFSNDDIKSLRGFLIRMKHEDTELLIYKQHYSTSFISKENKHNLQMFNIGNRFEIFESNMIRFNNIVDFFKFENKYYIINMKVLEKFFQFHSVIEKHAKESIEKITDAGIVENPEELMGMIENTTFARKLVKIGNSSPVLGIVPNANIISFIRTYPNLVNHLKINEAQDKIILDTKKSKEALIKILNDDYLTSQLTNHYYESLAKDEVQ